MGKFGEAPVSDFMRKAPEFLLENMIEFYLNTLKYNKYNIQALKNEEVVMIYKKAIIVLKSKRAISNPYLGAKLISCLSILSYLEKHNKNQKFFLQKSLMENEYVSDFIIETLVRFYVDIEYSGM